MSGSETNRNIKIGQYIDNIKIKYTINSDVWRKIMPDISRATLKDQLSGIKVVPNPNNKEKEILRALKHVEVEIMAHLDNAKLDNSNSEIKISITQNLIQVIRDITLGQNNDWLSKSTNGLITSINDFDQAATDLIAGAEAQAAEFGAELEKLQGVQVADYQLDRILKEIKSRTEETGKISPIYEELLDRETDHQSKISQLDQRLSVPGCENASQLRVEKQKLEQYLTQVIRANLASINKGIQENRKIIEKLTVYANAVRIVMDGLPEDIFKR